MASGSEAGAADAFGSSAEAACGPEAGSFSSVHTGNLTVTVVPFPSSLSREITPPFASTACFTMESPSPVPPIFLEWFLSTRKNLSNTRPLQSAGMPMPVSITVSFDLLLALRGDAVEHCRVVLAGDG